MNLITLYHAPESRSSRIIWLLEELEEPYAIRPVSIVRPQTGAGAPDPDNPHPDKQVPAIVHDEILVAESVAIVLYLTDSFPGSGLGPTLGDRRRGDYLTWLAWYAAALEPAMFGALEGDLAASPMRQRAYDGVVRRLETTFGRSPYLLGEALSGADILVASALVWARQAFPESTILDSYADRCRSRPAAIRALALDGASGVQRSE